MTKAAPTEAAPAKINQSLLSEIEKMAQYITQAKQEISELSPEETSDPQHLGNASSQLGAVVKATEEAAGIIMDAADEIQSIVSDMGTGSDAEMRLTAIANRLYEACNFQDITGQRINKVITALNYIEEKIFRLVSLFGKQPEGAAKSPKGGKKGDTRPDAHLLNGPALGDKPKQADIDALFAKTK